MFSVNSVKRLQVALLCGASLTAFWMVPAQAGDTADITVTATLVNRTCTPDWKNDASKTTIALGTVDGTTMTAKGAVGATGETTLGLSGCSDVSKVTVTANGTADSGDSSAFANSAAGTQAKGVAVLLKAGPNEDTVLKPDGSTSIDYTVKDNAVKMTFKAFLEANGVESVSDGAFSAPITLTMAYE